MIARPVRPARRQRALLLRAARASGCTCTPEIVLKRWYGENLQYCQVLHEHGCPALLGRFAVPYDIKANA